MITRTRWYATIIYLWVTGCGGTRLVREHHSGAHSSSSKVPMDSVSFPCGGAPITHYTQDLHYNIPSDWVVHNSPSGYINGDGWHKSIARFPSMCCSSTLNTQVLFCDFHGRIFDERALNIIRRHNIQYLISKEGDYVHDQPNDNDTKMKLKNLYGNVRMNWMMHHQTLKFSPPHMNYILVET